MRDEILLFNLMECVNTNLNAGGILFITFSSKRLETYVL